MWTEIYNELIRDYGETTHWYRFNQSSTCQIFNCVNNSTLVTPLRYTSRLREGEWIEIILTYFEVSVTEVGMDNEKLCRMHE